MSADLITLPTYKPSSAEWAEQRRRAIGGSEIAAILGLSKWESRFSLWHRKQGTIDPQPDNPGMEWGRRLEPAILAKYAENHGPLTFGGTFTRRDRPFQIGAPDARIGDRIVEAKTEHDDRDGEYGDPGTDQIPPYYRAQILWYMDVLDAPSCDLAILFGGSDYREYTVAYNADEAVFMRERAQEFIASIERNERPSIDEHSATYQAIRELHPEIDPVDVEIPFELARDFCAARTEAKQASDALKWQTSLLADVIGTARRATYLGNTIATRQARGDGTPYLVAGRNLPDFLKAA